MNNEVKTSTSRDIVKLIKFFDTHKISADWHITIEGFYEHISEKYGSSFLLFEKGTNIAWNVSGFSAKQFKEFISKLKVISPCDLFIELNIAYSQKYDVDYPIIVSVNTLYKHF